MPAFPACSWACRRDPHEEAPDRRAALGGVAHEDKCFIGVISMPLAKVHHLRVPTGITASFGDRSLDDGDCGNEAFIRVKALRACLTEGGAAPHRRSLQR
jgi:hypothetical protein